MNSKMYKGDHSKKDASKMCAMLHEYIDILKKYEELIDFGDLPGRYFKI